MNASAPTGPINCGCDDAERTYAELADYCDELAAENLQLRAEVERLRERTHEIQAQEMAKRAKLDSELAEWRQRYETAQRWTEDNAEGLREEGGHPGCYHPFWSMTSYNMRSTLMRLVAERDVACAKLAAIRAMGPKQ